MMTDYVLVTTTIGDDAHKAIDLVDHMVAARLAACAHLERITSTYWWDGEMQTENEYRVEFKTTAARVEELKAAILAVHSYDLPQLIVTPILDGSPAYLEWITAETTPR